MSPATKVDKTPGIADKSLGLQFFDKQLLNYKQAAQYLSISESYLRRLKSKGLVPCVLVSDRGIRFRVSSLNHWIEKREVT